MIDFHTHTFFSDGALSPAEHIRRAYISGYKVLGITDHVDFSNLEFVYSSILNLVSSIENSGWDIKVIPGIEITHVPASKIEKIVTKARDLKIPLIIVHGESPVEPVEKGTNRAAIESQVDILAHPGLIEENDVKKASELGISLEITARKGHSLTNGYVAKISKKYNTKLVLDSDAHIHSDFLTELLRTNILYGSGMDFEQIKILEKNMIALSEFLIKRIE
jgi:putative hydrolase